MTERYLSFLHRNKINSESSPPPKKPSLKDVIQESKKNKSSRKVKIKNSNNPKVPTINRIHSKHINTKNDMLDKIRERERPLIKKTLLTSTKFKLKNASDVVISLKESPEIISKLKLLDDSKKENKKEEAYFQKTNENEDKIFFEEYLAVNPDDMELDDALVKDKRAFSECLVEN